MLTLRQLGCIILPERKWFQLVDYTEQKDPIFLEELVFFPVSIFKRLMRREFALLITTTAVLSFMASMAWGRDVDPRVHQHLFGVGQEDSECE